MGGNMATWEQHGEKMGETWKQQEEKYGKHMGKHGNNMGKNMETSLKHDSNDGNMGCSIE